MAITARDIQNVIVQALASSLPILSYCDTNFSVPHLVSGGGTGRQGQDSAPAFAVVCWSRSAGEDDEYITIDGSIILSITDDSVESETTTEGVIVDIYGGPEKLEVLLEYAATELKGISADLTVSQLTYSFEPLEFFPLFVGGLDFTISYPVLIGGYEPTIS